MKRWPLIIVLALTVLWAAYFSWFTIGRHAKTNSARFDLGNMEQVIWNTSQGRFFTMTDPYGTTQVSRLSFHADFFLLALVPFYAVIPRTETLLLLQVLAVVSGAVAVWLIAKKWFSSPWWGVGWVVVYLINPGLQWSVIFDLHAITFAVPLILWTLWAALNKRWILMVVLGLLVAITKEQSALLLIPFVVWLWKPHRQLALIWLAGILAWTAIILLVVLPLSQPQSVNHQEIYQTPFGSTAIEIIKSSVSHPLTFIKTGLAKQNLIYGWQLSAPYGLLNWASPWTLGAGPDYLINALSLKPAQHLIYSHYTSGLTPWLIIGAMASAVWIIKRWPRRLIIGGLGSWIIIWAGVSAWAFGPLPGAKHDHTKVVRWRNVYAASIMEWAKIIPPSARISVTNNVGSHFARREYLYSFPLGVEPAEYIVVLEDHATPVVATQAEVSAAINKLRTDQAWEILAQQNDLTVLKRRP